MRNKAEYEAERQNCYKIIPTARTPHASITKIGNADIIVAAMTTDLQWYMNSGYTLHGFEMRKDLQL